MTLCEVKNLIIVLAIITCCYGCKKENPVTYSSSLIGEWSWISTCGGIAGCETPENGHITINLVFTVDSIYNYYMNDTLRTSYRFYVYKLITPYGNTTNVIDYGLNSETFSITHDILSFCNGISQSDFKRIK